MFSRLSLPVTATVISLLLVLVAVAVGWRVVNGDNSLLRNVSVADDQITPNADGDIDATVIEYEISRNAAVSIFFENAAGERFYFRKDKPRGVGDYRVLFSGIVEGYHLPDETVAGEILTRLLQDGTYTWTVEAVEADGSRETATGRLTIAVADPVLPEIRNFTIHPVTRLFTPNRDGINDRAKPQFHLEKDVADVQVFLVDEDGVIYPISELERAVEADKAGYHIYDYDAGVDDGAPPPPDGTYTVVALARDAEGQQIRVEDTLSIELGGVPWAEIFPPPAGDTVEFGATAVSLCDTIQFTLTVRNYGTAPIRTSGPEPGLVYDSTWNFNTVGWPTESGVFRVGIGFENELQPYPYRWAVGNIEDLEKIGGHYYLMPGERAVVTGGIRVVDELGIRNPQPMWAGLIHEDVEIAQFNANVDPHAIQIDMPDMANRQDCEPREIPIRTED
ncbi:MAG: hypothetical protein KC421_14550 [Anaerolineales bacterium]|nr:hypothetical protein [Anaerolineales bacterium]